MHPSLVNEVNRVLDLSLELQGIGSHDWLIYAVARNSNIEWFNDEFVGIYYRQHNDNVAGANIGIRARYRRLSILFASHSWYWRTSKLLRNTFAIELSYRFILLNFFSLRRVWWQSVLIAAFLFIRKLRGHQEIF